MEEKDPLDPQTVFTIKHSEIPQGITQCIEHAWIKKNDNELSCTKCPTEILVDPLHLNDYLN